MTKEQVRQEQQTTAGADGDTHMQQHQPNASSESHRSNNPQSRSPGDGIRGQSRSGRGGAFTGVNLNNTRLN